MTQTIPTAALAQHIAILGKTGSGKTSTEKLCVEQVVAGGFRVCILDSIKSDWWGITSSADGKRPGLPFRILGGPRGHVGLPSSAGAAIGQLVGSGKLPLSIVDMADFEPGGLQRFFVDFAPALMRHARGVVYLVIEEAHEFAPKEKSGVGGESMATHWAKKLATAGRSKGIRLIVATQRVQALHNAVLGSCETVIAHRLTTPADQEPVLKWMKANTDKETQDKVAASLSSLPTGTGWICSGEAKIFERVAFPKFSTFDNTATPTGDGAEIDVKTAPVDHDELRAIIGESVKEAEANDPRALRAEIAKLKASAKNTAGDETLREQIGTLGEAVRLLTHDVRQAEALHEQAVAEIPVWIRRGFEAGIEVARESFGKIDILAVVQNEVARWREVGAMTTIVQPKNGRFEKFSPEPPAKMPPNHKAPLDTRTTRQMIGERSQKNGAAPALTGPQRQFLKALAWWLAMGHPTPSRAQLAAIAGWRITSGHLKNVAGSLSTLGLITYPSPGLFAFTPAGEHAAPPPDMAATLHDSLRGTFTGPQRQAFDALLSARKTLPREELAKRCGWEPTSGHVKNVLGSLSTLEVVEYPRPGEVALQAWVMG